MKKRILVLFVLFLTTCLFSCGNKALPLENPEVDLFEQIYEGIDFSILRRIDIDVDGNYELPAYTFGIADETCIISSYERYNYMVLYRDKYYDLVEANKLQIITCSLLDELEVRR